jgi:hypothetical protein
VNYEIGVDTRQGVLLVKMSGILTQNGLVCQYLEVTDLLERYRARNIIVNLLEITPSPLSSKAISCLSRSEPLCISGKTRVFVASGRTSIDLWRTFISTNRNPTRTRLAGSMPQALELLDLKPLMLDVNRESGDKRVEVALVAQSQAAHPLRPLLLE